jgi:molybdopterin/thiamine biosynthesis adenylyltransferase
MNTPIETRFLRNKDLIPIKKLTSVGLVGLGGIGSFVVQSLGIMGYQHIKGWDADTVAPHNLSSTAYPIKQVGLLKSDAAKALHSDYTEDWQVFETEGLFTAESKVMNNMILATDDMESRRMVYDKWKQLGKGFLIDARMGASTVELVTITPGNDNYMETWAPTSSIKSAPCSMKHTVYATQHIASLVVSQIQNLVAGSAYYQYIWSSLSPNMVNYGTLIRPTIQGVVHGNRSKQSIDRLEENANGSYLSINRSA